VVRDRNHVRLIVCALLILVVLSACADEDSDRRFANDPLPTEDFSAGPTAPPESNQPTSTEPPVSPVAAEKLLSSTGKASALFVHSGSTVYRAPIDGTAPMRAFDAGTGTIETVATSVDGAKFAVITVDSAGQIVLSAHSADGSDLYTADLGDFSAGSPAPDDRGTFSLAWSPDGGRLLVGLAAGGILDVDQSGAIRTLLSASAAPSPRAVAWSPSGSAIAFVDAGPEGDATGLYVGSTDVLPIDPVAIVRPIAGQSRQIVAIAWPVGDAGILYSERSPGGDLSVGGDLFAISPAGGAPELVASARAVAQVAAVDKFVASSDGVAVAYSVVTPGEDGNLVEDLLVKQIDGPTIVDLAVETASVESMAWTTVGLAWASSGTSSEAASGMTLERAAPDGAVETISAPSIPGTPGPSPVAAPIASPVGSSVASPESDATPVE
jgi:hypothetical protein